MAMQRMSNHSNANGLFINQDSNLEAAIGVAPKRGMVLPFTPLAMSFDTVNYFVDMPPVRINILLIHAQMLSTNSSLHMKSVANITIFQYKFR